MPDHGDDTQHFDTIDRRNTTSGSDDDDVTDGYTEEEEEEEAKEDDVTSKLTASDFNHLKREKPLFSGGVEHSRACVPLKLCDGSEDIVPYTINRYLRDYQREGIRFIYSNYRHSRGCILGDDMGLGKTVQVFIKAIFGKSV